MAFPPVIRLRSFHPADVPSFTLPYHAVIGYGSFGDVLLPDPAQDAQVIAAWQNYGAPGSAPSAASPSPAPTTAKKSTPPPPTTTSTRPPWDPAAC